MQGGAHAAASGLHLHFSEVPIPLDYSMGPPYPTIPDELDLSSKRSEKSIDYGGVPQLQTFKTHHWLYVAQELCIPLYPRRRQPRRPQQYLRHPSD